MFTRYLLLLLFAPLIYILGFFAASLSTHQPDYFYTWTRDSALVAQTNDTLLHDYVDFQMDVQKTSTRCNCLGEPKFNKDGSSFKGLDYISKVWYQPSTHFFTLMVMRKALLDGIDFFKLSNRNVEEYKLASHLIGKRIETFWSEQHNYIMATQNVQNGVQKPSGLDVSTFRNDGFFTPGSDKMLATVVALEESFEPLYPINKWEKLGVSVNSINRRFFQRIMQVDDGYYSPESATLKEIIKKTTHAADKFLKTIQFHQARNGSMSEQYDRYIGFMAGARDLTWSHAAFITASKAKDSHLIQ
ncbi:Six-hairpin glycosidase-like protein [Mucor mucedo]|uniref:Six-hairpin glycosidase-like protein n=1 Tax=Mucor mucedo TaxID=29922 RepID=UPI002220EBFB|nr:Six-hairpin glycosidase-like protein [Mucor mucedo]XP_051459870.1 Six-hairpin glycosidase-like protein [Mucor mucedo]KAI7867886.1 Six-hairpin glycosidase-like protein [Mucor mucedo]KAI7893454.1 Six-hairpin glycosidase-like protein [Mucor mucedo]